MTTKQTLSEALRARLKAARIEAGLTQLEVAEAMGIQSQRINNWERGKNSPHTWALLDEWAWVLGVEVGEDEE